MEKEQLLNIINKGEGLNVEFKLAANAVPNDMYETVVSFSNTDGGTILLGVDDDGKITGIDVYQKNKMLKDLVSALNSVDNINPPLFLQPFPIEIEEKLVIVLQVPVSSQVHKHKGCIYIRQFESDIDITETQKQVSELYQRKSNVFTENQIIPNLTIDDLDEAIFEKARQLIRSYQSDHPWLAISNLEMLKEAVLWRKDFMSSQEGFTLACALIFGKDSTIQSILSAYKVEVLVRKENTDRWDDRLTLRTNLIDTYILIKSFINRYLPEKFYMEGDQRIDLRDKVFREVIGNIIVHREYNSALATEIVIDKFQLSAKNPNKPHFMGPIDLNSFNPFAKNPNIRKFFTALGWTDEIGSGIRNTKKYLPLYVNGAMPSFIEGNEFKTIIPLNLVTLKQFATKWLNWLDLSEDYLEHMEASLENVAINSSLYEATFDACIINLVPSYNIKGTKLNVLNWPKKQALSKSDVKKIPGYSEKSTKLIHKKVRYILSILSLTAKAISLDDMMTAIGYSNKATFKQNYLAPLEQIQFITKTDLINLTSPDQKYRLTEKGAMFLGNR